MNSVLWRVTWTLATTDISQSTEYGQEDKAIEWAEGLLKAGARGIVVTELIVGRTTHFTYADTLFQK